MTSRHLQFGFVLFATMIVIAGCAAKQVSTMAPDARSQYVRATELFNRHHFDEAVVEFQKVLYNYPGLSYVDSAQYWYAMCYYSREDYHLAVPEFRRLITNFPNSALIDDAAFMIGKSYYEAAPKNVGLDQSDTENAIRELTTFLEDYPNSDRFQEGELLLSEAIEKTVEKEFRSGRQYFRMSNLISSRIYLEDVVKEHPEAKCIPEALFLLARIDEKQSKYSDARDKLNNLINAFPKSEYATKAADLKKKMEAKISAGKDVVPDSVKVTQRKSE
jgi:outer membrane protein assembly factor BamD